MVPVSQVLRLESYLLDILTIELLVVVLLHFEESKDLRQMTEEQHQLEK
jgi:hypothetical protein